MPSVFVKLSFHSLLPNQIPSCRNGEVSTRIQIPNGLIRSIIQHLKMSIQDIINKLRRCNVSYQLLISMTIMNESKYSCIIKSATNTSVVG